jgi:hypothetical protein
MYNSGGELFQESLEIKRSSATGILDRDEKSENKLIFGIKTKSASSHEKVSNIGSSLSWISVKREESVKFGDVLRREDRVFGGNIFTEDGFEFFFLNFPLGHYRYFQYNKL